MWHITQILRTMPPSQEPYMPATPPVTPKKHTPERDKVWVVEVVTPHRDGRGYVAEPNTSPPDPSGGWEPFGVGQDGSIFWKKRDMSP